MSTAAKPVSITVSDTTRVSGLLQTPPDARACYVLAHSAGAGMDHPFMNNVARGLASRGIATLRYQFPYMQRGSKAGRLTAARARNGPFRRSRGATPVA
jgi:predicted alpha/beta-hydrolase family hydrolase